MVKRDHLLFQSLCFILAKQAKKSKRPHWQEALCIFAASFLCKTGHSKSARFWRAKTQKER